MGPKTGRVAKRAPRGKKGPSLPSEQLLEEHQVLVPEPFPKAQSTPETAEECPPLSPTRKKTQRRKIAPKCANGQLSRIPQAPGPKLSLRAETTLKATDERTPQNPAISRKRSWVVESPLRQQSSSSATKHECEFGVSIQDFNKLADCPTDSQLLDHCLSIVRQNKPLVGFQDSTPLGGTVWDSLREMENTFTGQASWDSTIHLGAEGEAESKSVEQLPQIEQAKSVFRPLLPIRKLLNSLWMLLSHSLLGLDLNARTWINYGIT
jgi:hypothetical protein